MIRGSVEENIGSGGERRGTNSEEGAEEVHMYVGGRNGEQIN